MITQKDYAELGFITFGIIGTNVDGQCKCGSTAEKHKHGKHPLPGVTGWQKLTKSVPVEPGQNLAILLGSVSGNIAVADLDYKEIKDENGKVIEIIDGFDFALRNNLDLPKTLTQNTASGTAHFLYRWPPESLHLLPYLPAGKYKPNGIDLLGDKHYIVAEPSTIGDSMYQWDDFDAEIAMAPQWMIDLAQDEYDKAQNSSAESDEIAERGPSAKGALRRAKMLLERCAPAIEGKGGHTALFLAAQLCVRTCGLTDAESMELLKTVYNPRCVPPWEGKELEKEFAHKIKDARKNGKFKTEPEGNTPKPEISDRIIMPEQHVPGDLFLESSSQMDVAKYWIKKLGTVKSNGASLFVYNPQTGVWVENDKLQCFSSIQSLHGTLYDTPKGSKKLDITVSLRDNVRLIAISDPDIFDKEFLSYSSPGVAFLNGFLTKEGKLTNHSPEHHALKCLPFNFESNTDAPKWRAFLESVFLDDPEHENKLALLQEFVGACLFGTATKYQKCLVLEGSGSNGKSVFCKTIMSALFYDSNCSVSPQRWAELNSARRLLGSKINIVEELPSAEIAEGSIFKATIDGGKISGKEMYANAYEFCPTAGHLFAVNHLPATRDISDGFWRRVVIVKFNRKFAERGRERDGEGTIVRGLETILTEERKGIAKWACDGAMRLAERGEYTTLSDQEDTIKTWRNASDSVADYLSSACKVGTKYWTETRTIFGLYTRFCETTGRKPVSLAEMTRRLKSLDVAPLRRHTGRGWCLDALQDSEWAF